MGHKIPITLTKAKKKQIYLPSKPTLTFPIPPNEHLQLINFHECANKRRPICMQKLRPACPQLPPKFIQLISRECFSSTTTGTASFILYSSFFSRRLNRCKGRQKKEVECHYFFAKVKKSRKEKGSTKESCPAHKSHSLRSSFSMWLNK